RCNFSSPVSRGCPHGPQPHNGVYVPKPATNELQTRSATAHAYLRSSTFPARRFRRPLFFSPTIYTLSGQPDLVQDAPNHCVDNSGDGIRSTIKGGNGWKNDRASLNQSHDVAGLH